ncbi:MAG: alanine:cation symporter family protein [Candidatus Eremiobacteraeota bacterium]|nr:alanine:cation symporter family protein [Candidatus Eremiobacteraeota bacterium]
MLYLANSAAVTEQLNAIFEPIVNLMAKILFLPIGPFPLIVLTLMVGAIGFTLYFRFINIRGFKHSIDVIRGLYDNPEDEGQISHFQALTSALSATIGLGNIAGVAVAIAQGGPGALFWMVLIATFGMTAKFTSACLAMLYRQKNEDGSVSGGPMYYLKIGLAERGMAGVGQVLAVVYAIFIIGGSLGGGNMFQANQSFELIATTYPALSGYALQYGVFLAILVGLVIMGGIERIGAATSKVVPVMVVIYITASLFIILSHLTLLPSIIASIVYEAFNPDKIFTSLHGGVLGVLVIGIRRAAFSNEAGVGSAAIAHSAAKTDEPIREGIVAMIGPFIDTIMVCSMTALVLLITIDDNSMLLRYRAAQRNVVAAQQAYHADQSETNRVALEAAEQEKADNEKGAALTSEAFAAKIPFFGHVLTLVVFLFSYSTMISWYYYGEKGWEFLFGSTTIRIFQGIFLCAVVLGAAVHLGAVLDFSDLMILSCAFPNIVGAALMLPTLKEKVDQYWEDFQAGKFQTYR